MKTSLSPPSHFYPLPQGREAGEGVLSIMGQKAKISREKDSQIEFFENFLLLCGYFSNPTSDYVEKIYL